MSEDTNLIVILQQYKPPVEEFEASNIEDGVKLITLNRYLIE